MKKVILFFFLTLLFATTFSSETFSKINTSYKQITEMSSRESAYTFVPVFINGQWWMYVFGGPGGNVLIDRYLIDE